MIFKLGSVLTCLLLISLTACSAETNPGGEPPTPAATLAGLSDAPTPTAEGAAASPTPLEITPATATPLSAQAAAVVAQALTNLNLRVGPGTDYEIAGSLPAQNEVTIVGRNEDGSWLFARDASAGEVWLSGDPTLVQVDAQAVAALPVMAAPPPPYDASNPDVRALLTQVPLVLHNDNSFTCASHAGLNNLLIPLREGNVIGPHAGDFVHVDLGNVLFRQSNGALRLIRENPVDRFAGGEESLSLSQALQMFERREIVWNGSFGEWPARGVTGCDESAQP